MSDFERKIKLCVDRISESKSQPKVEEKENLTEGVKVEETKKSTVDKYL